MLLKPTISMVLCTSGTLCYSQLTIGRIVKKVKLLPELVRKYKDE